jgi:hypothetical protein
MLKMYDRIETYLESRSLETPGSLKSLLVSTDSDCYDHNKTLFQACQDSIDSQFVA